MSYGWFVDDDCPTIPRDIWWLYNIGGVARLADAIRLAISEGRA